MASSAVLSATGRFWISPRRNSNVVIPALSGIRPSFREHVRRHVHTGNLACRSGLVGSKEAVKAASTSKIENSFSGLDRGDGGRISTAESHLGTFGNRRDVGATVAERLRRGRAELG